MDIDAVVLEKINNDTDFQNSLVDLSDDDKITAINTKKSELIKLEFDSLAKAKEESDKKFSDQKTRAEKAEALAKQGKKEEKTVEGITAKDVLILTGAGYTHEEDIEVIEKWAKFNGVSIRDALNDSTLKAVLSTRSEERRTAQATASKGSARGVSTPSAEAIVADASKGKLPDESKIDDLANARMALRKARSGK